MTFLPPDDLSKERILLSVPRSKDGQPVLGGIALLRRLGQGAMGVVYYAVHPRLEIEVAVKVLSHHVLEQEPKLAERFVREAQIAAKLTLGTSLGDHLVRIMDVGQEGDTHYLVMEYVRGESAGKLLKRRLAEKKGPFEERDALELVTAATRGLAEAHRRGIVHRDVKPDNILVPALDPEIEGLRAGDRRDRPELSTDPMGGFQLSRAKLADFGLAKPEGGPQTMGTLSHVGMGTPGFMAPEQALDAKSVGPAADVFAMGATLYALLTARAPFEGSSIGIILRNTETKDPEPLPDSVSPATVALVMRCLAKDASERPQNAETLLDAFLRARGMVDGTVRQFETTRVETRADAHEAKQSPEDHQVKASPAGRPAPSWRRSALLGVPVLVVVLILGIRLLPHRPETADPTHGEVSTEQGSLFSEDQGHVSPHDEPTPDSKSDGTVRNEEVPLENERGEERKGMQPSFAQVADREDEEPLIPREIDQSSRPGSSTRYYASATLTDEGEALEYVQVPPQMGDGVISQRDGLALSEFTTWMYDRLLESVDPNVSLPPESDDRAAQFWSYMWNGLDPETKAFISQMDRVFPAARANWAAANAQKRAAITNNVRQLISVVWGDQVASTASFLAGEISYDQYVPCMDAIYGNWLAARAYEEDDGGGAAEEGGQTGGNFDATLHDAVSTYLGNFIVYQ